jgi:hypothetical protein
VPVKIDKIEIKLDFHIYPIVDFEILICYPLEMLLHEKSSQGSLKHKSGETTFAILSSYLENPMVEHHLDHDLFKEMMLVSPFISPNIASPPDPFNV